jgi:hypothetical protein
MNPIEPTIIAPSDPSVAEDIPAVGATETEAVEVSETPAAARRADVIAEDAELVRAADALIASLSGDPLMAVELVQSWLRDLGIDVREDSALSNLDKARLSEALADAAHELEAQARASAADSNLLGQIFGWIGTGIAIAVSLVTSVFTGGASLALGIAAVACMVAAQGVTIATQEGLIEDPMVGMGISIALSVVASILSFGGSAAGSGVQTGTTAGTAAAQAAAKLALEAATRAMDAFKTVAHIASATVGVASGINRIVGTCFTHDADINEIEGERHELSADDARFEVDEAVGGLGPLMRQFRQMAERMAEVREARSAATSAAIIRV